MARTVKVALLLASLFFLVPDLDAHDFRIEPQGPDFMVIYGHGNQRAAFDLSKIKSIQAFDRHGKAIDLPPEKRGDGLLLKAPRELSWISVEIDDGYWSKTLYGWKNLPKREARRVVEAIRSFSYAKAILSWSDRFQEPDPPMRLNLIPLKNPLEMKPGDLLPLKVLYGGRPLAGIEAEGGDHQKVATTDQDGVAKIQLSKGYQVITVKHKERLKDDPDADYITITSTLAFEVGQ